MSGALTQENSSGDIFQDLESTSIEHQRTYPISHGDFSKATYEFELDGENYTLDVWERGKESFGMEVYSEDEFVAENYVSETGYEYLPEEDITSLL